MKTLKVILRKSSEKNKGIISIRITENRIPTTKSLGIKIPVNDWSERYSRVKSHHPDHQRINTLIEKSLFEFQSKVIPTKKYLTSSVVEYYKYVIDHCISQGTIKTKKSELNRLSLYLNEIGCNDIYFNEIDKNFVLGYKKHLYEQGLSVNTINKYLSKFRTIINKGIKDDLVSYSTHPFHSIRLKNETVTRNRLTLEEVNNIINSPLDTTHPLYHTRNYFIFQIFSMGMRVSDLQLLKWENIRGDRLKYTMSKTKNPMDIQINDVLLEILGRYSKEEYNEQDLIIDDIITNYFINDDLRSEHRNILIDYLKEHVQNRTSIKVSELYNVQRKIMDNLIWREKKGLEMVNITPEEFSFNNKRIRSHRMFLNLVGDLRKKIILDSIHKKTHTSKNDFIFEILKPELFKGFSKNSTLNKLQYGNIETNTAIYNRKLKKLQSHYNLSTTLSSHVPRHTYTEMMLGINEDLYTISKSLGHKSFRVTQVYTNDFHQGKVDSGSQNLTDRFQVKF